MQRVIISDSSCLIGLLNIGQLELLHRLYGEVMTTPEVIDEVGTGLPGWILVQEAAKNELVEQLRIDVDLGEATAIALATEFTDALVILDDRDARLVAIRLGLELTGTPGILLAAKRAGHLAEIRGSIDELTRVGFRMSDAIKSRILQMAGENGG